MDDSIEVEAPSETKLANLDDMPKAELAGHQWRQQGSLLICSSCPFSHSTHIGVDKQLFGIDANGLPMIRDIQVH
jgi:hypothetical protein